MKINKLLAYNSSRITLIMDVRCCTYILLFDTATNACSKLLPKKIKVLGSVFGGVVYSTNTRL